MTNLTRTMLAGGALALALAAAGPAAAQVTLPGSAVERGAEPTRVQYYERDRGYDRREERGRFRDRYEDDEDDRPRRSRRDEYGQGGYGRDGYGQGGGYGGRGNPYAQRGGNGSNICVTARGNCALFAPQPAASRCSCDIPGFGEKRGNVAPGGGGGGASLGGRGYDGGGYDASSGVIVRRGY